MAPEPLVNDSAERQLRQVCALLDRQLRSGETCNSEQLLEEFPLIAEQTDLAVELIYTEFVLREELGQQPDPADFYARFPPLAKRLQRLLGVHAALGQPTNVDLQYLDADLDELRNPVPDSEDKPTLNLLRATPRFAPLVNLPRMFGHYLLEAEIGRGGMGVVYQARHLPLDRTVALKMIGDVALAGIDQHTRFQKEATAIAQLNHPNIIQIYEVGEQDGRPFLALEYVSGGNLAQHVQHSLPTFREAAELVFALAQAIESAHARGIIHRDLKPANVLLQVTKSSSHKDEAGGPSELPQRRGASTVSGTTVFPKITDFGLACVLGGELDRLTRTGQLLGTPSYMAPEQVEHTNKPITPATDVYGLGAILYELLTGRPPFLGSTVLATLQQVIERDPVPPSHFQPGCPKDLETIVLKCLHKDPSRRYSAAGALANDLRCWLDGRSIKARPVSTAERMIKWICRYPGVSSLAATIVLLIVLSFIGIGWQWKQTQAERDAALKARDEVQIAWKAEALQRQVAQRRWYLNQIGQIYHEYLTNNAGQARELLRECQANSPGLCGWEWHYLNRHSQDYLLSLPGQSLDVCGVSFSSCGQYLATSTGEWNGTSPGEVRVWDAHSGELLRTLTGPKYAVYQVAFQPNGNLLAAADIHGSVWIWDWKQKETAPIRLQQETGVSCLCFDQRGEQIAFGLFNGVLRVWSLRQARITTSLRLSNRMALQVAFHPQKPEVAFAGRDGNVYLCDLTTRRLRTTIQHSNDVRKAVYTPDGTILVTAGYEGIIKLWDLKNPGAPIMNYPLGGGAVSSMACAPDGDCLAIGLSDGRLLLWKFRTWDAPQLLRGHASVIMGLSFSADGRRLAGGGSDRSVKTWDLTAPWEFTTLPIRSVFSVDMTASPKAPLVALAGGRNTPGSPAFGSAPGFLLVDSIKGERVHLYPAPSWGSCVAFRPDGAQFAGGMSNGQVRLHDVRNRTVQHDLNTSVGAVHKVAYRDDGQLLAVAGSNGIELWNPHTNKKIRTLTEAKGVFALGFQAGSDLLACGGDDRKVRLWNVAEGTLVRTLEGPDAEVGVLAFSPDGKAMAVVDRSQRLRIWNTTNWSEVISDARPSRGLISFRDEPLPQGRDDARGLSLSLSFSPDSKRLVYTTGQIGVILVDVETGREVLQLTTPGEFRCRSVAFSSDGQQIHAIRSGALVSWDARSLDARTRIQQFEQRQQTWHQAQWILAVRKTQSPNMEAPLRHGFWFTAGFHARRMWDLIPDSQIWQTRIARAEAEMGNWDEAQVQYTRAIERDRNNAELWYSRTITYLAKGDIPGYRQACKAMVDQFKDSWDPVNIAKVLYTCLPLSSAGGSPERMVNLARYVGIRIPGQQRLLGAALCRAGNYKVALEMFDASDRGTFVPRAWDWYFRAMAYHHLGRRKEALEHLKKAAKWIEEAEKAVPKKWIQWRESYEVAVLRKEVERLVSGK